VYVNFSVGDRFIAILSCHSSANFTSSYTLWLQITVDLCCILLWSRHVNLVTASSLFKR